MFILFQEYISEFENQARAIPILDISSVFASAASAATCTHIEMRDGKIYTACEPYDQFSKRLLAESADLVSIRPSTRMMAAIDAPIAARPS